MRKIIKYFRHYMQICNAFYYFFLSYSYTILAASAVPKGFVDAKKVAEAVLEAIQLDKNDYRLGSTKVHHDYMI